MPVFAEAHNDAAQVDAPTLTAPKIDYTMWTLENGLRVIAIQDDITVVASTCLEAGMKGLIHRLRPLDPHIGGQTGIAAQHPGSAGALGTAVEMDHLGRGMDAGIGAPGAVDPHGMRGDLGQCGLELALHGTHRVALQLPALECTTVIFHTQSDSHN